MSPGELAGHGREPPEAQRTTRTVRILDVVEGDLPDRVPSIMVVERLRARGGKERLFTQEIEVRNEMLFRRLAAEVSRNDEIVAEVVTEFRDRGYTTYLVAYQKAR